MPPNTHAIPSPVMVLNLACALLHSYHDPRSIDVGMEIQDPAQSSISVFPCGFVSGATPGFKLGRAAFGYPLPPPHRMLGVSRGRRDDYQTTQQYTILSQMLS